MAKKKRKYGKPFVKDDSRINISGQPRNDFQSPPRAREPKSVFDDCVAQVGGIPIGATLRPYNDSQATSIESDAKVGTLSQNWLIDEQKLLTATNDALKTHNLSKKRRNHTPHLLRDRFNKVGFGIQVSFKCGFKNCQFKSKLYHLYESSQTGQPLPNLQVGVALSKTDLTPKTVETLATTLNIDPPNIKTLYKSCDKALEHTEQLAETAMIDNRKEVTCNLRLKGEVQEGVVPNAGAAGDGQYSNRDYHYPTGKSDSVSFPIIEQVTGKNKLIQHINLSHRDGTLPPDVHINSGENMAAGLGYEETHETPHFPLHIGTLNSDGDTSLLKSMEAARKKVGESRPLKRKNCSFHVESAAKRRFTRESLTKLTPSQKSLLENTDIAPLSINLASNVCAACEKQFKNAKGLNIHRRACKGERAEECKVKGLEPLFLAWEKESKSKLTVVTKKKWRDGIRRWLLKRIKLELNLGLHAANPQNIKLHNDAEIHEDLALAGKTVIPCLSGNHELCLRNARGCGGENSPPDYSFLPSQQKLGPIPPQTIAWLNTIVDCILSREALSSLVINGQKGTTSHVESAHKEIRLAVPKGRVYRRNEAKLIKSGNDKIFFSKIAHSLACFLAC